MSVPEEPLSEYELLRQRNIKRNHEFMRSIGLPVQIPPRFPKRTKAVKKKRKVPNFSSDESDSAGSDEDWLPGSEDVRAQKKLVKRFMPEFRPKRLVQPNHGAPRKTSHRESESVNQTDDSAFEELGKVSTRTLLGQFEHCMSPGKSADSANRYPKRASKRCFREAEVPDDDHYLFCEECQDLHEGDCPVHGPLIVVDDSIVPDTSSITISSLAKASTPANLIIKPSTIPNSGLGVFSTTEISKGVRFGPYRGRNVKLEDVADDTDTSYMWEIMKDGNFCHFVDGSEEFCSNWMRFVNCSRSEDEQNLVAFQFRGNIFYRSYKTIPANTELLVWYGDKYAEDLGITVTDNDGETKVRKDQPECEDCGKLFTCFRYLERHVKYRCTAARKQNLKCPLCENEATTSKDASNHLRTHTAVRPNWCTLCNKSYKTSVGLTIHLRTHTGEKPFQCAHCSKAFSQANHLTKHLRTHTGEKPFQCTHCNKAFSMSHHLTTHLRTHTGEKPFQCTHCSKAFSQSGDLTTHLRTHTGEKPFQCTHCSKAFSQANHLTKHLRTHTGEKPFQCTHCSKAFSQANHLTTHLRTHTGEKPFQCTHCNKAFSQAIHLTKHLRTHSG